MRVPLNLMFLVFISVGFAGVSVGQDFTFSWQANPPDENVVGYRLYYGAYSRFETTGSVKPNFFYEYYIDISDFKRCVVSSYGEHCEFLHSDELQCENLYQSSPKCTVFNLSDNLFFAMTAYNNQGESDYTYELRPDLKKTLGFLPVVNHLILKLNMENILPYVAPNENAP